MKIVKEVYAKIFNTSLSAWRPWLSCSLELSRRTLATHARIEIGSSRNIKTICIPDSADLIRLRDSRYYSIILLRSHPRGFNARWARSDKQLTRLPRFPLYPPPPFFFTTRTALALSYTLGRTLIKPTVHRRYYCTARGRRRRLYRCRNCCASSRRTRFEGREFATARRTRTSLLWTSEDRRPIRERVKLLWREDCYYFIEIELFAGSCVSGLLNYVRDKRECERWRTWFIEIDFVKKTLRYIANKYHAKISNDNCEIWNFRF